MVCLGDRHAVGVCLGKIKSSQAVIARQRTTAQPDHHLGGQRRSLTERTTVERKGTIMDPVVESVEHADVWRQPSKTIRCPCVGADRAEGSGADLQFIIARRAEPGKE